MVVDRPRRPSQYGVEEPAAGRPIGVELMDLNRSVVGEDREDRVKGRNWLERSATRGEAFVADDETQALAFAELLMVSIDGMESRRL